MKKLEVIYKIIKIYKNWPLFFKNYFKLIKRENPIYELRNGIKYITRKNSNDPIIINEIWLYESYTPEFLKDFDINKNDVVLDIGAHIGIFSIFAAKKAKNGKIYSFEPLKNNYILLKKNLKINGIKNVIPINKAVSNKTSKKMINISNSNTGSSSFVLDEHSGSIIVQTTSLQKIISDHKLTKINFLKMDVEGAEYEILSNCTKNVLKKIDKISMEVHPLDKNNNEKTLKIFLEKNGFKVIIVRLNSQDKNCLLYANKIQ